MKSRYKMLDILIYINKKKIIDFIKNVCRIFLDTNFDHPGCWKREMVVIIFNLNKIITF